MQSAGFECWLCHPAQQEGELCKTRSAQDYCAGGDQTGSRTATGESWRETVPPGRQTRAQQDKISWRWDFTNGNTTTWGGTPFLSRQAVTFLAYMQNILEV